MTSCAVIECHFLAWLKAVAEVLSPCAFSKNITEATLTRHRFRVGIAGEATKRIFRLQVAYGQLPHFLSTTTTSFSFTHLHPSIKHLFLKLPTSIKTYNLCIYWKHTFLSCVDLYRGQNNPKQTNQHFTSTYRSVFCRNVLRKFLQYMYLRTAFKQGEGPTKQRSGRWL